MHTHLGWVYLITWSYSRVIFIDTVWLPFDWLLRWWSGGTKNRKRWLCRHPLISPSEYLKWVTYWKECSHEEDSLRAIKQEISRRYTTSRVKIIEVLKETISSISLIFIQKMRSKNDWLVFYQEMSCIKNILLKINDSLFCHRGDKSCHFSVNSDQFIEGWRLKISLLL